jgi:catechol 2,3-dioxygenase-like lactoylglutathione lyase family enzyme
MLLSVWHTSWTVSDLDRSIDFYIRLLGFELVGRWIREGTFIETVVGFDDAVLDIAVLRIPQENGARSGHHLELIAYIAPRGVQLDLKTCNVGAAHLALETDSIHETCDFLAANGVMLVSPPVAIETGNNTGGFACYLRDPDGFTLELVQRPQSGEAAR